MNFGVSIVSFRILKFHLRFFLVLSTTYSNGAPTIRPGLGLLGVSMSNKETCGYQKSLHLFYITAPLEGDCGRHYSRACDIIEFSMELKQIQGEVLEA